MSKKMNVYKVNYKLFNYVSYVKHETLYANIRAYSEDDAVEKLKKMLKTNGHRLSRIISVEVNDNPNSIMADTQNERER